MPFDAGPLGAGVSMSGSAVQHTLGRPLVMAGPGLHTARRCRVVLHPAPPGHGRRAVAAGGSPISAALTWANRVPTVMSTTVSLGDGRALRTIEHMMAAFAALGLDNVLIEADGPEVPILDGSSRPWVRAIERAGLVAQPAPRREIAVLRPVQLCREGGFLRVEPAPTPVADITYSLLRAFPILRWQGRLDRDTFVSGLMASRSFGQLDLRARFGRPSLPRPVGLPPVEPHRPDPDLPGQHPDLIDILHRALAHRDPHEPVLQGARPGRAALVVGRTVLPWRRYPLEPLCHVVLDMIGDLALAGAPLRARVVAHNPSHEKTFLLIAALMADPSAWTYVEPGAP